MTDKPEQTQEELVATSRLVTSPIRMAAEVPGQPQGRRILCELTMDVPWLSLWEGEEVVVILATGEPGARDLDGAMLAHLLKGNEEADHGLALAFEGLAEVAGEGDERVFTAKSWHGRRPSQTFAEQAITDFLCEKFDVAAIHFQLVEDGDETNPDESCGWAFWMEEGDTTSYLKANMEVEWYGTSWTPDAADEEDGDEPSTGPTP